MNSQPEHEEVLGPFSKLCYKSLGDLESCLKLQKEADAAMEMLCEEVEHAHIEMEQLAMEWEEYECVEWLCKVKECQIAIAAVEHELKQEKKQLEEDAQMVARTDMDNDEDNEDNDDNNEDNDNNGTQSPLEQQVVCPPFIYLPHHPHHMNSLGTCQETNKATA